MNGKQLKNSILQWAIQGKLVPQDPNDEPASVLLERIREEKARLVKEKKIKKDKNESIIFRGDDNSYYEKFLATGEVKCIDEEIPFEIPEGWEWERWGNISLSIQYGYNAPAIERGDIKMVRISDIHDNIVKWSTVPFCHISPSEIDTYLLKENDILFARTGGTVGKSFLVQSVPEPAIYAGYLIRTRYSQELCPQYLKSFMESQLYWDQLKSGTIATAQPNCNGKTLGRMLLPIPPKAEQRRLVQKLESLIPLFKRYTKAQFELDTLNEGINEKLKKSILQEAIQGKLLPQDPSDESASELLARIREEKLQLLKEGKLKKKDITDSVIFKGEDNKYYEKVGKEIICIDEEIPFDIPESWTWARVKDIFIINPKNTASDDTQAAFIPMEKISATYDSAFTYDIVKWGTIKKNFTHIADGDVAFAKITPCFQNRKSAIFEGLPNGIGAATTELKVLRQYGDTINRWYLLYFLESPYFIDEAKFKGTANQQRIISGYLENKLFPLPPKAEQDRIAYAIKQTASIMSR